MIHDFWLSLTVYVSITCIEAHKMDLTKGSIYVIVLHKLPASIIDLYLTYNGYPSASYPGSLMAYTLHALVLLLVVG